MKKICILLRDANNSLEYGGCGVFARRRHDDEAIS
jgi:hypothetical protein